jgi:hypothetical protein
LALTAVDAGKLEPAPNGDGARLTLTEKGGTKISTTRYVHYGLIDFTMRECQALARSALEPPGRTQGPC